MHFSPPAQQWIAAVLFWIGFGIATGLVARALVPTREPIGVLGTLSVGILGSIAGPLLLSLVVEIDDLFPLSPLGFLVSVGGAAVLLLIYRLLLAIGERTEKRHPQTPLNR